MNRLAVGVLLLLTSAAGFAQGIECTVTANTESVGSASKDLLVNFASDIRDYVNNYQWGAANVPEKVRCSIEIFFNSPGGSDKYTAQVSIGSQRPIYKSNRSTAVLHLRDDTWEFTYLKNRPLTHNQYNFNDLTSFLDYYMSIIVGYDCDTYEPGGGSPYFARAAEIASMGNSSGSNGWAPSGSTYTRCDFIQELLLPGCEPLRSGLYTYHFIGLDSMAINPSHAQESIIRAINMVAKAKNNIGPRSWTAKLFFDSKYMEIAEVLATYPDKSIYKKIEQIDPNHTRTYDEYFKK